VLGVLALAVMLGFAYRIAAPLLCVGFTYVFLLDEARYLNHFYLICLLAFILAVVPAHAAWSVDASRGRAPAARRWAVWLVRFQVGAPYFFGGLAKANADWLNGEPLRSWLAEKGDLPLAGPLLRSDAAPFVFAYGGLVFDLCIVPLLLYRRTRPFAFVAACVFHLTNSQLFSIGVFPFLMIIATTIFFPPEWPRRFVNRVSGAWSVPAARPCSLLRVRLTTAALVGYAVIQLTVPLRHHFYPGDVSWTEEGHRFSWHMKLRDKSAAARFLATDPSSRETFEIDWRQDLATWQYEEMSIRPDMILQYAQHVSRRYAREHGRPIEVRALVAASLNARAPRLLVDPTVDLSGQARRRRAADWIVR